MISIESWRLSHLSHAEIISPVYTLNAPACVTINHRYRDSRIPSCNLSIHSRYRRRDRRRVDAKRVLSAVIDENVDFALSVHPFAHRREMKGVQTVSSHKAWLYLQLSLATVRDVLLIKIPTRRESDARREHTRTRGTNRAPTNFNRWHHSNAPYVYALHV